MVEVDGVLVPRVPVRDDDDDAPRSVVALGCADRLGDANGEFVTVAVGGPRRVGHGVTSADAVGVLGCRMVLVYDGEREDEGGNVRERVLVRGDVEDAVLVAARAEVHVSVRDGVRVEGPGVDMARIPTMTAAMPSVAPLMFVPGSSGTSLK